MQPRFSPLATASVSIGRAIRRALARSARRWRIGAAIVLSLATVVAMTGVDGYRTDGPSPLANADFSDGLTHWTASRTGVEIEAGTPPRLRLHNENPSASAYLAQTIAEPSRFEWLRLSVEVRTESVVKGARASNRARVALASHDAAGRGLWYYPHILFALSGSHDWRRFEKVFAVGDDAAQLRLSLQLSQATGTMWLRGLSLEPVVETPAHLAGRAFLVFAWAIYLIALAAPLFGRIRRRPVYLVVLLAAGLILLGTLSPKKQETALEERLLNAVVEPAPPRPAVPETAAPEAPSVPNPVGNAASQGAMSGAPDLGLARPLPGLTPGKLAHLLLFAVLGVAAVRAWREAPVARLLGGLYLAAAGSEVLQLFAQGRDPLLADIGFNAAGATAGAGAIYAARFLLRGRIGVTK